MLRIKNLEKSYGKFKALDNLNLEIEKGEIFGFIGPNGAGKSTLINIMTTILYPDRGTIKICGFDILKEPVKAKECIGYVPQDISLLEELNAYGNLEYFGKIILKR